MPRATFPFSRGTIISNFENNHSAQRCLEILTKIKEKSGEDNACSLQTIERIYKQWRDNQTAQTNYSQCGRKPKYTVKEEKKIKEVFEKNSKLSLRQVENDEKLNPQEMPYSTIRRTLNNNDISAFKIPAIQLMNDQQKRKRLDFANKHIRYTQKWNEVLFTDETILKKGKIGNKYIWKTNRDEITAADYHKKEKYPKQKIHLWGVIGYEGGLYIQEIEGNLNAKTYFHNIQNFINYVEEDIKNSRIFQQDQASAHTAKYTLNYLTEVNLTEMKWPPKGADISPIKRVWEYLKDNINKLSYELDNKQLKKHIKNTFFNDKKIQQVIKRMYQSIPYKIKKVIEKKGEQINI